MKENTNRVQEVIKEQLTQLGPQINMGSKDAIELASRNITRELIKNNLVNPDDYYALSWAHDEMNTSWKKIIGDLLRPEETE